MALFELATPRDLLAKTQREYQRLVSCVDIDNVFNFLVTANHIRDYVLQSGLVSESTLDTFTLDQDIKDCSDLANTGKHLVLTRPPRVAPATRVVQSYIGAGKVGEMMVGSGEVWLLGRGDHSVDIIVFAGRVVQKWETFFKQQGL
jgi:hypothetical protein